MIKIYCSDCTFEGDFFMQTALLERMLLSRCFEMKLQTLFEEKKLKGTTHLSIGQEAAHVGLAAALKERDCIVPTHRCHGYNIARGTSLYSMFSEMLGSRHGICAGLGGSMHMTDMATFNAGSSAVVGSGVGLALGLAFAADRLKEKNIAVAIFGDGATSRGIVHEAMNLASVENLPLLFFCENNLYGMSAASRRMISGPGIAERAAAYGIEGERIDGNGLDAVIAAVTKARAFILEERRPYFIEAMTYRQCGHSKSDKLVYRSREEELLWKEKDPICSYAKVLGLDKNELKALEEKAKAEVEKAWQKAYKDKDDILSPKELQELVFTPGSDSGIHLTSTHEGTYRDGIYEGLRAVLKKDDKVYFLGEDIGRYGGCFSVSKDLYSLFPERVIETPVCEEAFTQMAVGAAFRGLRPIVEIMYGDFSTLASDALINHAAKSRFMSAGQLSVPMIYRTPIGSGTGHGAQHTQSLETMFMNVPGLIIVAPSDAWSAKALLLAASRVQDPVLYFEHKALYDSPGEIPEDDVLWPLGKARMMRSGSSLTIVSYSHALSTVLKAVDESGFDAEVVDLMTIRPWDKKTVFDSILKTGRLLFVDDNPECGSVGSSVIAAAVSDKEVFSALKAAPCLLSGPDYPVPFSPLLEAQSVVGAEAVKKAAETLLDVR
jgi:Pyruvate/2-oxoglutarate dehydrogenase complex, dehydrogenase (E1) component, eukaryotic type, beta subunit